MVIWIQNYPSSIKKTFTYDNTILYAQSFYLSVIVDMGIQMIEEHLETLVPLNTAVASPKFRVPYS
jgi:hypothetical protein